MDDAAPAAIERAIAEVDMAGLEPDGLNSRRGSRTGSWLGSPKERTEVPFGATPGATSDCRCGSVAAVESLRFGLCGAVVNAEHNHELNPNATRRSLPTGLESLATNPA